MAYEEFLGMYQSKLTTADEAVKVIKSGDWVDYGFWMRRWHAAPRSWRM